MPELPTGSGGTGGSAAGQSRLGAPADCRETVTAYRAGRPERRAAATTQITVSSPKWQPVSSGMTSRCGRKRTHNVCQARCLQGGDRYRRRHITTDVRGRRCQRRSVGSAPAMPKLPTASGRRGASSGSATRIMLAVGARRARKPQRRRRAAVIPDALPCTRACRGRLRQSRPGNPPPLPRDRTAPSSGNAK